MIVLRHHKDEAIGARHCRREFAVFERFAGVVHADGNFPDIDQFRFDIVAFRYFVENEICRRFG